MFLPKPSPFTDKLLVKLSSTFNLAAWTGEGRRGGSSCNHPFKTQILSFGESSFGAKSSCQVEMTFVVARILSAMWVVRRGTSVTG